MNVLEQGLCKFKVIEDVSKKSGNKYKAIKLIFKDWELSSPLFINDDQYFLIQDRIMKKED